MRSGQPRVPNQKPKPYLLRAMNLRMAVTPKPATTAKRAVEPPSGREAGGGAPAITVTEEAQTARTIDKTNDALLLIVVGHLNAEARH